MSAHMKKHPIKSYSKDVYTKLYFDFGNEKHTFRFVPIDKLLPIKKLLNGLIQYEDKTPSSSQKKASSKTWKALFKNELEDIGGVEAYRESALSVRSSRKELKLSQKALATLLRVDQAYLSKIECAKIPVGKKMATRLSEIFNISYKVFLSELPK